MPDIPSYPYGAGSGLQTMVMPERVVYAILKGAFELAQTNQAFIDRAFRLLSPEERQTIKTLLVQRPPQVVHNYAKREMRWPLIAVVVADDGEDQQWLDNYAGVDLEDLFDEVDSGDAQELFGSQCRSSIQVMIWARTPDVAQYYYALCWLFLSAAKSTFTGLRMEPGRLSGGDVEVHPEYLPADLYGRQLNFSLSGPRIYTVDGSFWTQVLVAANIISV